MVHKGFRYGEKVKWRKFTGIIIDDAMFPSLKSMFRVKVILSKKPLITEDRSINVDELKKAR
jgi:hypothetical protein